MECEDSGDGVVFGIAVFGFFDHFRAEAAFDVFHFGFPFWLEG